MSGRQCRLRGRAQVGRVRLGFSALAGPQPSQDYAAPASSTCCSQARASHVWQRQPICTCFTHLLPPGEGRVHTCLRFNKDRISERCRNEEMKLAAIEYRDIRLRWVCCLRVYYICVLPAAMRR